MEIPVTPHPNCIPRVCEASLLYYYICNRASARNVLSVYRILWARQSFCLNKVCVSAHVAGSSTHFICTMVSTSQRHNPRRIELAQRACAGRGSAFGCGGPKTAPRARAKHAKVYWIRLCRVNTINLMGCSLLGNFTLVKDGVFFYGRELPTFIGAIQHVLTTVPFLR